MATVIDAQRARGLPPEHCAFAFVQSAGDALLHQVHIATQPVVGNEEHAHAVPFPALRNFVQLGEAAQQLGGALFKRAALETSLRGVFGVNQWKIRQIT